MWLLLGIATAAAQQLYMGPALSWIPGSEHPIGPTLDLLISAAPGEGHFTIETGWFLDLRFPGLRELRASTGLAVGPAWVHRTDTNHTAFSQVHAELGVAFGAVRGTHVGLAISKTLDPWLLMPPDGCTLVGHSNAGPVFSCMHVHGPLSAFHLRPRFYAIRTGTSWEPGADLGLTIGWLPGNTLL